MVFKKGDLVKIAKPDREWLYFVTEAEMRSNSIFAMPQHYDGPSHDPRGYYYSTFGVELCSDILRSLYEK